MRLGTVTFQANDSHDIFQVADVYEDGVSQSDEELIGVEDAQFESSSAFVTGHIPKFTPVSIDGDTSLLAAWFKADAYSQAFVLRIYVQYEETEELMEVESEDLTQEKQHPLDPIEIYL
jgi:hypothetical protein